MARVQKASSAAPKAPAKRTGPAAKALPTSLSAKPRGVGTASAGPTPKAPPARVASPKASPKASAKVAARPAPARAAHGQTPAGPSRSKVPAGPRRDKTPVRGGSAKPRALAKVVARPSSGKVVTRPAAGKVGAGVAAAKARPPAKVPARPAAAKASPPLKAPGAAEPKPKFKPLVASKSGPTVPAKTQPAAAPNKSHAAPPAKAVAAPGKVAAKPKKVVLDKFMLEQRALLVTERENYVRQAASLKAEADQLATEMEPGESEFSEEGGEGGNLSVERELDLRLSAQHREAAEEIDRALAKLETGAYGLCEKCGQPIPRLRLKALPAAPLCVACKSGGLSRR